MLAPRWSKFRSGGTASASRTDRNIAPRTYSSQNLRHSPILTRWASGGQRRGGGFRGGKTALDLDLDGPSCGRQQHPRQAPPTTWAAASATEAVAYAPRSLGELMAIDEDREETDADDADAVPLQQPKGLTGWHAFTTPPPSPPMKRRSSPGQSRLRQSFNLQHTSTALQMDSSSCCSPPGPTLAFWPSPTSTGCHTPASSCDEEDEYMLLSVSDGSDDDDGSDDGAWSVDLDCDDDDACFSRGFDMTPEGSSDCLHDLVQYAFGVIAEEGEEEVVGEENDDDDGGVVVVSSPTRSCHTGLRSASSPRATSRRASSYPSYAQGFVRAPGNYTKTTAEQRIRIKNVSARWCIPAADAAELVSNVDSAQTTMF